MGGGGGGGVGRVEIRLRDSACIERHFYSGPFSSLGSATFARGTLYTLLCSRILAVPAVPSVGVVTCVNHGDGWSWVTD